MANSTSALVALTLAFATFAAMQMFRVQLGSSQGMTILGGFLGSNLFVFLVTAVSNLEMELFGPSFQARLFPDVVGCLAVSTLASALVHRVCVTTCVIFSLVFLYFMNNISARRYESAPVPVAAPSKKRR